MWFAYSPDRKGEHSAGHLQNYTGILQADGYTGFSKLYEKGRIVEAACWAHVRRKFHDLYQAHRSPIAKEALERSAAAACRLHWRLDLQRRIARFSAGTVYSRTHFLPVSPSFYRRDHMFRRQISVLGLRSPTFNYLYSKELAQAY